MPRTWKEILKSKGQTDAQIAEIEKTLGGNSALFDGLITEADTTLANAQTLETSAKEKETRINKFWADEATPQINEAYSKKAAAEASAAFYRTQAEEAKKAGFLPADAPGFEADKDKNKNFRPGENEVPGSPGAPKYLTEEQAAQAFTTSFYITNEHMRLFGEPLPGDALPEMMREAREGRTNVQRIWETKYKVGERRSAIDAKAKQDHDDAIRKEEREKVTREYGERNAHPDMRPMSASTNSKYVGKDGQGKPDRLAWAQPDAKKNFREKIHQQVAEETRRPN